MRILLIEDDEDVARMVTTGMGEAGHQVTHASNGDDGMAFAVSEAFDVMIFDRQLPGGVDGANLLHELRTREIATPVLFLSGLGGLQDWIKGLDSGGDDYIVKPFVFADLLERVQALHAQHVKQKANSEV
jgi:two-component system OmpR family response regulator